METFENERQINKKQVSQTSQSTKISSMLQEIKICPKSDILPFCTRAFNYEHNYSLNCTSLGPNYYNLFT